MRHWIILCAFLSGCVRFHTGVDDGALKPDDRSALDARSDRADGPPRADGVIREASSDASRDAPDGAKADAPRPDALKPDTFRPDGPRTDGPKPDTLKPDTRKPDTLKPDTLKPDTLKPDTLKPDSGSPSACSSATGLELCISFSSVQGTTVHDESGKGRDGTLRGAATVTATGKVGPSALLTGGTTDSVDFGLILGSYPQLTVMAWFKLATTAQGWDAVVSRWDTFKGYWLGGSQAPGGFEWWIDNMVVTTGKITTTGWTHLAGTYDESAKQMKIYVNGVLQAQKGHNGAITPPPTFPLELGHGGTDFSTLNGQIDEVRIWSVVRTQQEICSDAGGTPAAGGGCTL